MTISAFSDELAQVRTKKKENAATNPIRRRSCCGCICCKTSMT